MNPGLTAEEVAKVKAACAAQKKSYIIEEIASDTKDWANFRFVGKYKGKEVVFDAFLYTLEMEFFSQVFEEAKKELIRLYPQYANADFDLDEGKHIELLDEVAEDFANDEDYQVQEFVETDEDCDYGVAVDFCLNLPEIDEQVIAKVVKDYNNNSLKLDKTFYAFSIED